MEILDIGCGIRKTKGSIGIDISLESDADVICDVSKGLPFKDNSFDKIYILNVLEHFTDSIFILKELWRISSNRAKIIIKVPHFSSVYAWIDLDHKKSFSFTSFDFLCKKQINPMVYQLRFKNIKKLLVFDDPIMIKDRFAKRPIISHLLLLYTPYARLIGFLANLSPLFCERFWCYYVGGFNGIYIELETVK